MLVGLVMAGLVVCAFLAGRLGRTAAVTLALVSLLWLLVNGPAEGAVLLEVTHRHGLTSADLAGLAGLGVAAWAWFHQSRD